MKRFGMLLLYFFTWRTIIIGSVFVGLALLALALSLSVLSPPAAAAAMLVAYVLLLVVPLLTAPITLRTIISNRRLSLTPGLPMTTGLALLLLTLLNSLFLPLSGWLLGAPGAFLWLGPKIFVIASLYTLILQVVLTSRHIAHIIQWGPVALIVLVSLFREQLWSIATSNTTTAVLAALALAGWLFALAVLVRKRSFKPQHVPGSVYNMDTETMTSLTSLLKTDRVLSPTGSLLLGYPANLWSRALNVVMLLLIHPLLSVLLMKFMARTGDNAMPMSDSNLFLTMSLFVGFVTGAIQGADSGARARLLWLRLPGTRAKVWETLESEFWVKFLLQFALAATIAVLLTVFGQGSAFVLHYVLLLLTLTLYQSYLLLCSRINRWSSLTQALVTIASLAATGLAIFYSLRAVNLNVVLLLELCLLLLSVLFRALAKFGFNRVDWQVLRHNVAKPTMELS